MYPELFKIPGLGIQLYSYGFVLAIAFVVGLWVAARQATSAGLDRNRIIDLGIWTLIAGLVGARLALLIVERSYYLNNPRELLWLLRSGGVFYGGLLAAMPLAFWLIRRYQLPAWPTLDALAPGVALAQAIGRLGCLAAGCCFGTHCEAPWAITFTNPVLDRTVGTPLDVPLHPTQLYESFATLAIFFLLLWLAPRKRFHGQVLLAYLAVYAVARFLIEMYRGDHRGSVFGGALSTSQFVAILVFVGVLALLPSLWKRQRITPAATPS